MGITIDLSGRTALVTGGSRRIGRAISLELAAAGAAVVVNGGHSAAEAERVAQEIEEAGGRALAHIADVSDPEAVRGMVARCVAHFGGLDILVHCAAVRPAGTLDDIDFAEWRRVQGVIVDGGFLLAQHAAPHLRKGGGAVVYIGGLTSHVGSDKVHVATAKAALQGLTRSLAKSLGPDGVRVNLLVLGHIEADTDDDARRAHSQVLRPVAKIPLGRYGTPKDVATAVVALCGGQFGYATGQTLHLNGGFYFG